jgi:hypothetical protein
VESSWSDSGPIHPAEWSETGDPDWAGGKIFTDARKIIVDASPEELWPALVSIGGEVGWYYADWLWKLRGIIDRLFGGVGLSRGRRDSEDIYPGDALDFWRVLDVEQPTLLMLNAEMKLPGEAVLNFHLHKLPDGRTELHQIARFLPRGLLGLLYWYAVMPFHSFIFNGMLRGLAAAVNKTIDRGPEKIPQAAE